MAGPNIASRTYSVSGEENRVVVLEERASGELKEGVPNAFAYCCFMIRDAYMGFLC